MACGSCGMPPTFDASSHVVHARLLFFARLKCDHVMILYYSLARVRDNQERHQSFRVLQAVLFSVFLSTAFQEEQQRTTTLYEYTAVRVLLYSYHVEVQEGKTKDTRHTHEQDTHTVEMNRSHNKQ